MVVLIIEAILFGIISYIFGNIIFDLSLNKKNNNRIRPYGISIAFFTTGILLYLFTEIDINNI